MRRWALAGSLLLLLVLAGLLVAPHFVDWNRYRPQLVEIAEHLTGRPIAIEGNLDLSLLPTPTLSASGIRVGHGDGSPGDAARIKSLDARIAFAPLLAGHIRVRSVALIEPEIAAKSGLPGILSWQTGDDGLQAGALDLDSVIVVDGRVAATEGWPDISGINAELVADAAAGSLRIAGDAIHRGIAWRFEATRGHSGASGLAPLNLTLGPRSGNAQFRLAGTVRNGESGPLVAGRLHGEGNRPAELVALLGTALAPAFDQRFTLDAQLDADGKRLALDQLAIAQGEIRASGAAGISFQDRPRFDLTLQVNRLDLDRTAETPSPQPPAQKVEHVPLSGSVDLSIEAVNWHGGLVRQLHLDAAVEPAGINLRQVTAQLPGNADAAFYGTLAFDPAWLLQGTLEGGADNLRSVLSWLGVETGIPADRLRRVTLKAGVKLDAATLDMSNLDMSFDSSRLTGNFALALRDRPALGATLVIDRINLDAYIPRDLKDSAPFAVLTRMDGTLQAKIGSVTWNTLPLRDLALDGSVRDGTLDLRELSVRGEGETDVARLNGTVMRATWPAELDLTASVTVADPARIARLLDAEWDLPGLGALTAAATLKGRTDRFDIAGKGTYGALGIRADGLADTAQGVGTLAFALDHRETLSLARSIWPSYRPVELTVGPFTMHGSLSWHPGLVRIDQAEAQLGPTAVTGSAMLDLSQDRPRLDVDIAANRLALDPYLESQQAWFPAGSIDLGPLDGRISAKLGALDVGRLGLSDLKATVQVNPEHILIPEATARAFDGDAALVGSVPRDAGALASLDIDLAGIDLRQLSAAFLGASDHEGRLDLTFHGELPLSDARPLAAANGEGTFTARAGIIDGIDASALERPGGRTRFTQAEGRLILEKGVLRPVGAVIETPAGRLTPAGRIDLSARTLDLVLGLSAADRPPSGVRLLGPLEHPERRPER